MAKKSAESKLYDMQYHDKWIVDDNIMVIRTVGGWIYVINWDGRISSVFIPLSQVR